MGEEEKKQQAIFRSTMNLVLKALGIQKENSGSFAGEWLDDPQSPSSKTIISPINATEIAQVRLTSDQAYETVISKATENFQRWQSFPAPRRGEIIREISKEVRRLKKPLAQLITLEMGKIFSESEGEIQEVIDIADYAVGLSRQLYGLSMHSERPQHRMYEQWHPLGNIAVITAFNFPAAVWSWNAFIAAVCGDSVVWKPSELTPLTAIALVNICHKVTKNYNFPSLFTLVTGDGAHLGQRIAADKRFPLVSATGSCRMGQSVGQAVAKRFGKTLLELGGNNAVILLRDADLDLALQAVLFGAIGTAGQRCTTTRRVIIEQQIYDEFVSRLLALYQHICVGNPLGKDVIMGPTVGQGAIESFTKALLRVPQEGGKILFGGNTLSGFPSPWYLEPTIIQAHKDMPLLQEETFAPILYLISVRNLEEAIEVNNSVAQGLSSALFTDSLRHAELFLSTLGSDCGIANINIGTSGAEIGGAFGGEKETGGGREAGSDSWKAYMRRQTTTINWGKGLPLAQGIQFYAASDS